MKARVYIFGVDEGEQEIDDESIIGKFLQDRWADGFEAINAMAVDVNAVAANADNCAPPSKRRRDGIVNSIRNDERIQADAEACYDEQHGIRSNDDIAAIARHMRRMRDEYEQRIAELEAQLAAALVQVAADGCGVKP